LWKGDWSRFDDAGYREYVKITVDYPVAAAKAFSTLSDSFKFVYVSSKSGNPLSLMPATALMSQVNR
jgi:hypothetical protein